jgi:flagellar FliL protein
MAEDVKKGKEKGGEKDGEHGHDAPAKKSKKLLFIIIGVVVLLIAGGGAFYMLKIKEAPDAEVAEAEGGHGASAKKGEKTAKNEKGGHGEKEGAEAAGPQLIALDPFIVNLMNATATRYLKVTINMDVDASAVDEITAKTAQVRDTIIILLSSKSYNDVGTVTGKYQLRDEIVARVNMLLETGKVNSVYFTEFVIQ